MRRVSKSSKNFWFFIILALVVGAGLRLYMLSDQILVDDEWHGLKYVANNSFTYIFTHFIGATATCIPMNLYRLFLLKTVGWSELLLKAPSLIAGLLSLIIFPLLTRKILGKRAALTSAFLLAISPLLIFYSRDSRPYSTVVFLAFISILSLYLWATEGSRKYAVIYILTAVLAIYFHLFAMVAVIVPLAYTFVIKAAQKYGYLDNQRIQIAPNLSAFVLAAAIIVALLSAILVPPLMQNLVPVPARVDQIKIDSMIDFSHILSGTANKFVTASFLGLLAFGQMRLCREKPLFGGIFLSTAILYFVALIISRPESIHVPIVISRYVIPLFPLSFILVGFGMDGVIKYFQTTKLIGTHTYSVALTNIVIPAFLIALFFTGPLRWIYSYPNNFTNHPAFTESYQPPGWERPYNTYTEPALIMKASDIPDFYRWLAEQPEKFKIIEYPMDIVGDFNFHYYYQHFHKKTVLVGYITNPDIQGYGVPKGKSMSLVTPGRYVDKMLSGVPDTNKLKFRNMVDMMNISAVWKSGARYIILHKYLSAEMVPSSFEGQMYMPVAYLNRLYRESLGSPIFENQDLVVFEIKK